MADNKSIRIQDDLYHFVNGAWLDQAVIPDDRPTAGGFADLDKGVEKILMILLLARRQSTIFSPF